jgi:hypothetical protein
MLVVFGWDGPKEYDEALRWIARDIAPVVASF